MTELIGYVASILVLVSIMQTSVVRLRVIGLAGSIAFLIYGIQIESWPIAGMNVIGAAVHTRALVRLVRKPAEVFELLHVRPDAHMVERFMSFYADDLAEQIPNGFECEPGDDDTRAAFVLRDMVPAGLIIWRKAGSTVAQVIVDYVTPQYRDLRIARFVYADPRQLFRRADIETVTACGRTAQHGKYLERMGFTAEEPELTDTVSGTEYRLDLPPPVDAPTPA